MGLIDRTVKCELTVSWSNGRLTPRRSVPDHGGSSYPAAIGSDHGVGKSECCTHLQGIQPGLLKTGDHEGRPCELKT